VRDVLARLAAGELGVDEALAEIRRTQLLELAGRARLDLGRPARRGLPEVVLAAGKTAEEASRLAVRLAHEQGQGLTSRLAPDQRQVVVAAAEADGLEVVAYGERAVALRRPGFTPAATGARAAIVTAGTSDREPAEEARMVLEAAGVSVRMTFDVGVAGLHRLIEPLVELEGWAADVYIVAAGMDGVLPGVVAGLVGAPVIGLPVPTGYGAGGEGEAALLTMLQSCSTGLVVVNIGNGVGAGAAAALIAGGAAAARRSRTPPGREPHRTPMRPRTRRRSAS
jgi:NCAIR mutase (PurE)-related protein